MSEDIVEYMERGRGTLPQGTGGVQDMMEPSKLLSPSLAVAQAPRKRVNVTRNSKGYSCETTVETYNGESTEEIMAMVSELQAALEARYPREA